MRWVAFTTGNRRQTTVCVNFFVLKKLKTSKILASILTTCKLKHKYPVIPAVFHLLTAVDSSQALGKTKLDPLLCTITECKTSGYN